MSKLMVGTLALLTAMAFAGGNVALSAEATHAPEHSQAQMAPEVAQKTEASGKQAEAKTKKAQKNKKAKKSRKSTQPAN